VLMYTHRLFLFSSRRRHTRSKRDWSSDVCSSDLSVPLIYLVGLIYSKVKKESPLLFKNTVIIGLCLAFFLGWLVPLVHKIYYVRSEERRVGKECRSWWSETHHHKKI